MDLSASPDPSGVDLNDASVLVTGGTGSFGQAFVRHMLATGAPRRLVVFSRDEQKQFDMQHEFPVQTYPALRYFIGDVRDRDRLQMAMRGVDYVIHAAALKHVPAAEYNPFECIQTNVHGAENVVRAAIDVGVKKVIALSTDKAANPINLYGASKLAADKIFIAANHLSGKTGPRFAIVRYGNVLGSRGSVVPFFRRLIDRGEDSLPITDARMTRFAITLQQGVNFVLSTLRMAEGGEIFVPKIPSIRIVDLAEAMAPGKAHRIVGIRPGEKLHELMITEDDARTTIEADDRYIIEPAFAAGWRRKGHAVNGFHAVAESFRYGSEDNPAFLSIDETRALLAAADN